MSPLGHANRLQPLWLALPIGPSPEGGRRWDYGVAAILAMAVVLFQYALADLFYAKGLLSYGALFQADPERWIPILAHGEGVPTFRHPLFQPLVYPSVVVISQIVLALGPEGLSAELVRERVLLFYAPIWGGIKVAALYGVLRLLALGRVVAALGAIVCALSFSQWIYMAVPESVPASGMCLAVLMWLTALSIQDARFDKLWIWAPLGVLMAGVTITNIGMWGFAYWAVRGAKSEAGTGGFWRSGAIAVGVATIILGATLLISLGAEMRFAGEPGTASAEKTDLVGSPAAIVKMAITFPTILWYTLFAGEPLIYDSPYYKSLGGMFTVADFWPAVSAAALSLGALALALPGMGAAHWARRGRAAGWIAFACVGVIIFQGGLHSFVGTGWYFYSQHWHAALLILLFGWFVAGSEATRRGAFATGLAGCVVLLLGNANVLLTLVERLSRPLG